MSDKTLKSVTKRLNFTMTEMVVTKDASGECIIQGYANTSSKDRVGDVVDPKAFEASLPVYQKNPILLANHDWEDVAGRVNDCKITDKGLWIQARISDTRPDLKTLVREKCLSTFSIGYNEIDADYDESTKTKLVKQLELLEISIVTIPANHEAMFEVVETKTSDKNTTSEGGSSPLVNNLRKFVSDVETALSRKLSGNEVGAACSFFIENKGNEMKTADLIKLLTEKSAAPMPAPVKSEPAPAASQEGATGEDPMKAITDKLDAIAQGLAGLLQAVEKLSQGKAEEPKPEEEEPKAPNEEEKTKPSEEEEEEELPEDCEKELEAMELEIARLEAEEENN